MLTLTRSEPENFQIRDHRDEIKNQLLTEAHSKLFTLKTKLIKIESKRVKSVNDELMLNELTQKI